MRPIVKILSNEELDKMYPKGVNSRVAKRTRKAIAEGYSIALIEEEGLHENSGVYIHYTVKVALKSITPKGSVIEMGGYTDMSKLSKDKIYCAFRRIR